jgi:hypothetical protein
LFRTIKIEAGVATASSRSVIAATLTELQERIERMRGITIHQTCLDNPLAAECQ